MEMKKSVSCKEERIGRVSSEDAGQIGEPSWGNTMYAGKLRYRVRVVTISKLFVKLKENWQNTSID